MLLSEVLWQKARRCVKFSRTPTYSANLVTQRAGQIKHQWQPGHWSLGKLWRLMIVKSIQKNEQRFHTWCSNSGRVPSTSRDLEERPQKLYLCTRILWVLDAPQLDKTQGEILWDGRITTENSVELNSCFYTNFTIIGTAANWEEEQKWSPIHDEEF